MILVIADDFTGAAEMGAVAFRYGLAAEVQRRPDFSSAADVLVLDADTRSLDEESAASRLEEMLGTGQPCPESVFKKVDSVLRGPVVAELRVLMQILNRSRTLLVPANPALGRVVKNGRYFIQGRPIDQTDFSEDPEHPIRSSDVKEILRSQALPGKREDWDGRSLRREQELKGESSLSESAPVRLVCRRIGQTLPRSGIIVGDAFQEAHLLSWADRLDATTLAAGAAQFFAAYLERVERKKLRPRPAPDLSEVGATLFVSGSSSAYSRALTGKFESADFPVHPMPRELFDTFSSSRRIRDWAGGVISSLQGATPVRIVIGGPILKDPDAPQRLVDCLAMAVEIVIRAGSVQVLCIEGGATVSALLRRLGWWRLSVQGELALGVVMLQPADCTAPLVVTKPGSYPWPTSVWPRDS